MGPVGGHGVGRSHGAERHGAFVGAFVAHNSHGTGAGEHREVLPAAVLGVALAGLLKQTLVVGVELLAHDGVGVLEDLELLLVDRTDDADGQTRTRERMAGDPAGPAPDQARGPRP